MIFRTPFFLPILYPGLRWRMPATENTIYLTFDDGPIPGPTEFVLEQLNRAKASATFFCIGDNVSKYPDVFRKILQAGHSIGNHTYNHLKGWNHSDAGYTENIKQCDAIFLREGFSVGVPLFRPPYGRIRGSQIRALTGYSIIMWDVLTHDYSRSFSPQGCLNGTLRAARSGSIVVFHDSLKAEKNMTYALPRFLDHFGSKGYAFKALPNA